MAERSGFLLVEDHADVARAIAHVLSSYRPVQTAASVAEARAALASDEAWCGVVVDVALRDGSGLDVLATARARDRVAAALVVTGALERDLVNRAFELDAAYLCKPVRSVDLRAFASRAVAAAALPVRGAADHVRTVARHYRLSPRETEVLAHGVARRSRHEILDAMAISDNTLKGVVRSLLQKLDAANLDDAALGVLSGRFVADAHAGDDAPGASGTGPRV